jgi:two-component system response regulator
MNTDPILLVEDNPDDVTLTLRALSRNNIGNEVVVAGDGEEALRLLFENGLRPALVLLDLKLPKLGGLEVLERIRAAEPTRLLPVVVLTSSREEEDVVAGYLNGANSYIRKPVAFGEFVDVVRQVGLYWLLLNEPVPASVGAR